MFAKPLLALAHRLTTLAISMLMAKQTNVTTSLTTTTAMTREQKGPRPSVSFSTAICSRRQRLSKLQGSLVLGRIQTQHAVRRTLAGVEAQPGRPLQRDRWDCWQASAARRVGLLAGLPLLTVQDLRGPPLTAEAGDLAMARTPASAARASSWAADKPLAIGSSGASNSTAKKTAMKLQMESPVVMASTCSNGYGQPDWQGRKRKVNRKRKGKTRDLCRSEIRGS